MHNTFKDLNMLGSLELKVERQDELKTCGRDVLLLFVFFFEQNNFNSTDQMRLYMRGSWKSHEWINYRLFSDQCRFIVKEKVLSLNLQEKSAHWGILY